MEDPTDKAYCTGAHIGSLVLKVTKNCEPQYSILQYWGPQLFVTLIYEGPEDLEDRV